MLYYLVPADSDCQWESNASWLENTGNPWMHARDYADIRNEILGQ